MAELKSFDRVADVYDETRGVPKETETQVADAIAGVLRDIAPAPRLLEVGIGTGRMAVPLAERGIRVTGIDISPAMLGRLRDKRSDIDVMLAEAARPPLRPASFDAALFVHILHLVPDAEATVRAVLPLVRPRGGIIYGADDAREGIRDEAQNIIQRTATEVTGVTLTGWKSYDESKLILERVLDEIGATVDQRTVADWSATTSGSKMLARLARKDFSSSWLIPDEALPEVLRRVEPQFHTLFGDLATEHPYGRAFSIMVGRLPG